MKRTYDNFEFISDTMNYSTIESEVSNYYNLGFPESSNFMPDKIGNLTRLDQRLYGRSIVDFYGYASEEK